MITNITSDEEMLIPNFELADVSKNGNKKFSEVIKEKMLEKVESISKKVHISDFEKELREIDFLIDSGWISSVNYEHEGDWVHITIEEWGTLTNL